jgi:hypothetical protein
VTLAGAVVVAASCQQQRSSEPIAAVSAALVPSVGTALVHTVTPARIDNTATFPRCNDGTSVTPPPNGVPPVPPFGNGLSPPLVSFEGMNRAQSCNCFAATDDSGMVGPNNFVQTTNCAVEVFDRAGARLAGPIATSQLFGAPAIAAQCAGSLGANPGGYSDATVTYDRYADRWVVSRFANDNPSTNMGNWNQCFAVSQTSDPAGAYDLYAFRISATLFNDYPKMGVWSDAYYMTADANFIFSGTGNLITAFDRTAMLAGADNPGVVTFFLPAPPATPTPPQQVVHTHMLPAFVDGPTLPPAGAPNFVVQVQDDDFGFAADALQVYEFHVDWTNPGAATFTATNGLPTVPFHSSVCSPSPGPFDGDCLPQPNAGVPVLDSLSYGYMMQRLVYRTFADHEALVINHTISADDGTDAAPHSAIRWYELRRQGGPWSIFQQGTYVPDANDRWLGSIAMDKDGDIALGFDITSSSVAPSIRYVGRHAGDPLGTLPAGEQLLVAGAGSLAGSNGEYGDYSTMSVDPTDDCRFWVTNTYVPGDTANNEWHTRVGAFRFGSCNNPPVARCRDVTVPANGMCLGPVATEQVDNGSFDPDGDSINCTLSPSGPFGLGGNAVTLTCTDPSGAMGSCTATVTVVDQTPPVVTPPADRTVAICTDSAQVAVGQATATDNCATGLMPTGEVIALNGVPISPPIPVTGGEATLSIGTNTIQWTVSDGTNTGTADQTVVVGTVIEAGQSFLVDDRGRVLNAGGGFGAVLNAGTGTTRIGQDTRTGAVLSRGPVIVQHRAMVNGNVVSASTVTRDADANIGGTVTQNGTVVLPPLPTLPAFPAPTLGSFTVNSGTQAHGPGSYVAGTVNGGTLVLAAGDYFFDSLTINAGTIVRATPTTRVFVRDTLVFNSSVRATVGTAIQAITLGFAGANLSLFAAFNGTLIAPNADVLFGTGAGLTFTGSFFGRILEVTPASTLVCSAS